MSEDELTSKQERSLQSTTNDALKSFFPGQKFSLQLLDDHPAVSFTVSKLFTPVTKSVVVLAKHDPVYAERSIQIPERPEVIVKIYDPRYLDDRISHPWSLDHERISAIARPHNATLSNEDLIKAIYTFESNSEENASVASRNDQMDILSDHHAVLWEEEYYRLMLDCYDTELRAYKCLQDLQGSAIPRLYWAGTFSPPLIERLSDDGPLYNVEERPICPPALVLEYIPSLSLEDISPSSITPELCSQIISALECFPSCGVVHQDVTPTNVRFAPPTERPTRGFIIDFGCAAFQEMIEDEDYWKLIAKTDALLAEKWLEEKRTGKKLPSSSLISD